MDADINELIDIVETRIKELSASIRIVRSGGKCDFTLRDLESLLRVNEDMLLCLKASRDYDIPVTVSKVALPDVGVSFSRHRIIRSVFPTDHPLHGKDNEWGEMARA